MVIPSTIISVDCLHQLTGLDKNGFADIPRPPYKNVSTESVEVISFTDLSS